MRAADYVMLPWTIKGPRPVTDGSGTRFEMRIAELPGFVMQASSESEALYGFKKSLLTFLESVISLGQIPQAPAGQPIHYSTPISKRAQVSLKRAETQTGTPVAAFTTALQS